MNVVLVYLNKNSPIIACVIACMTAGSVLPAMPDPGPMPAPGAGKPSVPTSLVRAEEAMDGLRECALLIDDIEALEERPCSRRRFVEPYLEGG